MHVLEIAKLKCQKCFELKHIDGNGENFEIQQSDIRSFFFIPKKETAIFLNIFGPYQPCTLLEIFGLFYLVFQLILVSKTLKRRSSKGIKSPGPKPHLVSNDSKRSSSMLTQLVVLSFKFSGNTKLKYSSVEVASCSIKKKLITI